MTTPISASTIAAQAFRFMELSPISSFADDDPRALAAAEQYPDALRICLERHDWSFARVFVQLAPVTPAAPRIADPDLPYAYRLPGDCVKLRTVYPQTVLWRLDNEYLFSDQADCQQIRYTRLIEDEARLPSGFKTLVSLQLAVLLMPAYVGSRTKRADLRNELATSIADEMRLDAHSAAPMDWQSGEFATVTDWAAEATR